MPNSGSGQNSSSQHRRHTHRRRSMPSSSLSSSSMLLLAPLRQLLLVALLLLARCSSGSDFGADASSACASCGSDSIPARFAHHQQQQLPLRSRSRRSAEAETKIQLLDGGAAAASNAIPVEFYRALSNVTDFQEFFERFDQSNVNAPTGQEGGFSENYKRSVERAAAIIPRPANCMPENTIVPLTPYNRPADPTIIFVPSCTRVKRCGGCCGPQLSCQPVETEMLNFQILEYKYGERSPKGKQIVPVEQHTRCVCDCRIKPADCNSYQEYDAKNCRCDCTNSDEKNKCNALEHKIWDERECRCVCRDSHSCTTGTVFDEIQCRCVNIKAFGYYD